MGKLDENLFIKIKCIYYLPLFTIISTTGEKVKIKQNAHINLMIIIEDKHEAYIEFETDSMENVVLKLKTITLQGKQFLKKYLSFILNILPEIRTWVLHQLISLPLSKLTVKLQVHITSSCCQKLRAKCKNKIRLLMASAKCPEDRKQLNEEFHNYDVLMGHFDIKGKQSFGSHIVRSSKVSRQILN